MSQPSPIVREREIEREQRLMFKNGGKIILFLKFARKEETFYRKEIFFYANEAPTS